MEFPVFGGSQMLWFGNSQSIANNPKSWDVPWAGNTAEFLGVNSLGWIPWAAGTHGCLSPPSHCWVCGVQGGSDFSHHLQMMLIYSTKINNETFFFTIHDSVCSFWDPQFCPLVEPEMCGGRGADLEGLERSILSKPQTPLTLSNQNQGQKGEVWINQCREHTRPVSSKLMG